jgi:hypothetical protein
MERSVRRTTTELARLYGAGSSVQSLLDTMGIRNRELSSWPDGQHSKANLTNVEIQDSATPPRGRR